MEGKKIEKKELNLKNTNNAAFYILNGEVPKGKKIKSFIDIYGNNIWHYLAFSKNSQQVYLELIDLFNEENKNHLNKNKIHFMDYFLTQGKIVDYYFFLNNLKSLDYNRNKELQLICMQKKENVIKEMVLNNIEKINSIDSDGNTPLKIATLIHSTNVMEFLLSNGADPNIVDFNYKTPLHYAAEMNDIDKFNLLENYYSDDTIKSSSGKTPLDLLKKAMSRNQIEIDRVVMHSKNEFNKFKKLEE